MRLALCLGLGAHGAAAPAFDPATQALTQWYRDFAASPWAPTASAGTSGTLGNATTEGVAPVVGPSLNGHASARCNGTTSTLSTAATYEDIINVDAYSGWTLFQANGIATSDGDATPYNNAPLIGGWGIYYFGVALTTDGGNRVQVFHRGSTEWKSVPGLTISLSTPTLVQYRYNGTKIEARINSGAWQEVTHNNVHTSLLTQKAVIGGPSFASTYANADIWEIGMTDTVLDDTAMDNDKAYINARYGLSL